MKPISECEWSPCRHSTRELFFVCKSIICGFNGSFLFSFCSIVPELFRHLWTDPSDDGSVHGDDAPQLGRQLSPSAPGTDQLSLPAQARLPSHARSRRPLARRRPACRLPTVPAHARCRRRRPRPLPSHPSHVYPHDRGDGCRFHASVPGRRGAAGPSAAAQHDRRGKRRNALPGRRGEQFHHHGRGQEGVVVVRGRGQGEAEVAQYQAEMDVLQNTKRELMEGERKLNGIISKLESEKVPSRYFLVENHDC